MCRRLNHDGCGALAGTASQSRGNANGSTNINDDDPDSSVDTSDGKQVPTEDWFAVTLDKPVAIRRVVFAQGGRNDGLAGGYFASKPKVQAQREVSIQPSATEGQKKM